jgi:hypothetical protein
MLKKIFFQLEQDDDGYPPVTVESVWAEEASPGQFVLDNIPFFITQATLGDVVEAAMDDGVLTYKATVQHKGNSLVRVHYYKETEPSHVREHLENLGCSTEMLSTYSLIAVNIPADVKLDAVQAFLQEGAHEGKWDYEEPLLMQ